CRAGFPRRGHGVAKRLAAVRGRAARGLRRRRASMRGLARPLRLALRRLCGRLRGRRGGTLEACAHERAALVALLAGRLAVAVLHALLLRRDTLARVGGERRLGGSEDECERERDG